MRRDKTVARILLIFSIANVVLAAPALVRQRRRLVTDRADNEPTDEPEAARESLAGPVYQNEVVPAAPPSEPGSEHGTPPESRRDSKLDLPAPPVLQDWDHLALPPLLEVRPPAHVTPSGSWEESLDPVPDRVPPRVPLPPTLEVGPAHGPEPPAHGPDSPAHGSEPPAESEDLWEQSRPPPPPFQFEPYDWYQKEYDWPSMNHLSGGQLLGPFQSWQKIGVRPPTWEVGQSSNPAGGRLLGPFQSWQHIDVRPPTWELGESSNSAGESSQTVGKLSQTVAPPAVEAQLSHDEKFSWRHEFLQFKDVDRDQGWDHKSSGSDVGSEVEQMIADESYLRD